MPATTEEMGFYQAFLCLKMIAQPGPCTQCILNRSDRLGWENSE